MGLRLRNGHHIKNTINLYIHNQCKVGLIKMQLVCFLSLEALQLAGPSAMRAHARAAQLAWEVLSLKNDTFEYWILTKPTLYRLYIPKYTMFLIWWPFLNLKPTLLPIPFFLLRYIHIKSRPSFCTYVFTILFYDTRTIFTWFHIFCWKK